MKFIRSSMSWRLLASAVGVFLALSCIYIPISLYNIKEQAQENLREKVRRTAKSLSWMLSNPLWNLENPQILSNAEALMMDQEILAIQIYDEAQKLFFTTFRDSQGKVSVTEKEVSFNYPDSIEELVSIDYLKRRLGYVRLYYSDVSSRQEIREAIRQYAFNTVLLVGLTFLALWWFVRHQVTRPVKRVNALMTHVAAGNYDKEMYYQGEDEIGQMVHSFEQMRQAIRQQIRHIEQQREDLAILNTDLERKVRERTQSLEQRSLELEREIKERRQIEARMRDLLEVQQEIADNLLVTSTQLQQSRQELEQKNTILEASNLQLEDLRHTYERILQQLNELYQTHLPSLHHVLGDLNTSISGEKLLQWQEACRALHEMQESLKPIASLYVSEQVMRSKKVLLAESNKKQQILAKMALSGTGVELDIVSDLEQGRALLEKSSYDIICSNLELLGLVSYAHEKSPQILSVFMTSEDANTYLSILREYPSLSNIVSQNEEDRAFTLKNILTTVSKLLTTDLFGLEKYLNWGVDVQQRPILQSDQREALIHEMETYFKPFGFRKGLLNKCAMVAEELLMNSIYDAPSDAQGVPLYNHLPRTQSILLKPQEQGLFRYACDGLLLAISVQDPFGAFSRQTILDYLEHCYRRRTDKLDEHKGGGGYGLFQIMQTADLLVFNVKPRIRTEVIALFNLDPNITASQKKNAFHYFSL